MMPGTFLDSTRFSIMGCIRPIVVFVVVVVGECQSHFSSILGGRAVFLDSCAGNVNVFLADYWPKPFFQFSFFLLDYLLFCCYYCF